MALRSLLRRRRQRARQRRRGSSAAYARAVGSCGVDVLCSEDERCGRCSCSYALCREADSLCAIAGEAVQAVRLSGSDGTGVGVRSRTRVMRLTFADGDACARVGGLRTKSS
jgi:hypothetical protein